MARFTTLCLMLLCALSSIGYAGFELTEVYYGKLTDETNFSIENKSFYITALGINLSRITFPTGRSFILEDKRCAIDNQYHACLNETKEDDEDFKNFNIEEQRYPLLSEITVYRQESDLSISRPIDSDLLLGEDRKILVTLQNKGAESALNLEYEDKFPPEVKVISCNLCFHTPEKVTWKGDLGVGEKRTFWYKVKGNEVTNFTSNATLVHGETKIVDEQLIKVVDPPLGVSVVIPTDLKLDEEGVIRIDLENNNSQYDVSKIDIGLSLPDEVIKVHKAGSITKIGNTWKYLGHLKSGSYDNMTMNIKSQKLGKYEIGLSVSYVFEGSPLKKESSFILNITTAEPVFLVKEDEITEKGDEMTIPIDIVNPSSTWTYHQIRVSLAEQEIFVDSIAPKQTLQRELIVPKDKRHEISYAYYTSFDQQRRGIKIVDIELKEQEKSIAEEQDSTRSQDPTKNTQPEEEVVSDEFTQNPLKLAVALVSVFLVISGIIVLMVSLRKKRRTIDEVE